MKKFILVFILVVTFSSFALAEDLVSDNIEHYRETYGFNNSNDNTSESSVVKISPLAAIFTQEELYDAQTQYDDAVEKSRVANNARSEVHSEWNNGIGDPNLSNEDLFEIMERMELADAAYENAVSTQKDAYDWLQYVLANLIPPPPVLPEEEQPTIDDEPIENTTPVEEESISEPPYYGLEWVEYNDAPDDFDFEYWTQRAQQVGVNINSKPELNENANENSEQLRKYTDRLFNWLQKIFSNNTFLQIFFDLFR